MEMTKSQILSSYRRVSPEYIEEKWTDLYDLTLNHCTHGPNCKIGKHCEHGRRIRLVNILGGERHTRFTRG